MVDTDERIEERVERAVRDILAEREAGERPVVAEKAHEYRVSRHRIQRRLKGIGPRTSRIPKNYKLSEVQEQALVRYVLSLDGTEQSICYDDLRKVANDMLVEDHIGDDPAPVVGLQWARRFLTRHPELDQVKPKAREPNKRKRPPPPPRPSPPPEGEISPPTTPLTARALEQQAIQLENASPGRRLSIQEKFIKGALIQVRTAAQVQKELAASTAPDRERRERRCHSHRQLQTGGVLYASQAREMIAQRAEEGGTQLQRALRRAEALREEIEDERRKYSNLLWEVENGLGRSRSLAS